MSTIFANIKYLLAPVLILVTFAGVLAGGIFAWLGVALLFVGIVIDTIIKVYILYLQTNFNACDYGLPPSWNA